MGLSGGNVRGFAGNVDQLLRARGRALDRCNDAARWKFPQPLTSVPQRGKVIGMTRTETPAPTATFDVPVAVDLRWANGVELTLPAANSVEYFAFLAGLQDYESSR